MSFLKNTIYLSSCLRGLFALLLVLVFGFYSPSFSEEIIVNLKAESLKYDEGGGVVLARGNVEARLKEFVINADEMRVDAASNVVTAEGNVRLSTGHYNAVGDMIMFDARSESASISNFYTIYRGEDVDGEVFIRIEKFYDEPLLKWGSEGDVTTCDYDSPHYDVKAKRFEFYPEDKLVGYSVTFYINGIPVMWLPYWVYSFKRKRASLMPVVGHNEVEGNFAKFAFDYFIDNDAYGLIYIDLMQKKGLGKGVEHLYRVDDRNSGSFFIYHLEERDTGLTDWVGRVDHQVKIDEQTKVNLLTKYADIYLVPYGRLDQTYLRTGLDHSSSRKFNTYFDILDDRWGGYERYNYQVRHNFEGYDTDFLTSFSRGKNVPRWNRFNTRLSHRQPLMGDNWKLSTLVNFYRNATSEGAVADERLEPQVELVDHEDEYTLRIFQNWYIDTDRDLYKGDSNDEYLEKQPEVTLSLKPRDYDYFTLNTSFGFGKYHEVRWISETSSLRHFTTERYSANLTGTKSIDIGYGSRLSLLGGVEQYLYGPGDARYVLREEAGISTGLGGFFSNSVKYSRAYSEGNTPFYFDIVGVDQEWITDSVTFYYLDKIRWVTSCGYNFRTDLYNDLLSTLTLRPDPRLEGRVSAGYDINNQIYRDLVLGTTIRPIDKVSWTWDSVHDINNNIFKSANSLVRAEIGEDWRYKFSIEFRHSYDYFDGKFILRDLTFVKDLHCWESRFVYSDWRKEWRLSFTLKAFPQQPVGWGAGQRGYFFEGFSPDRFMQQFDQPSPTRY
jgi:LPS-assembly protein